MGKLLNHLWVVGAVIRAIEKDMVAYGPQRAVDLALKKTGTKLVVEAAEQTTKALQKAPVLLLANHPNEADVPALIASTPPRKDASIIVNSHIMGISAEFDKYLIPVYVKHRMETATKLNLRLKILRYLHRTKMYHRDEAHQKNIQNIAEASRRINAGGLVAMFPGAGEDGGVWLRGVGHLIAALKHKDALIVMAHIQGTSDLDYLRLIPGTARFFGPFRVSFHSPIPAQTFAAKTPRETTALLNTEFRAWTKGQLTK